MSSTSSRRSIRIIRRSVRWHALKEYVGGALWVLPTTAALIAIVVGFGISQIEAPPESGLSRLAFQGTADDARALLISITSTVVTVIALVLGLTVVALQLSSTQFSPRLLRNFLRDRATQVVLSAFIATFVYSAAGLFTVGVEAGERTEDYPRLAVSGAIVLLFVSLGMVVYFADHLVHSIQIDAINRRIEQNTRRAIAQEDMATVEEAAPQIPKWAVPLVGRRSGYIQTVYPLLLLPLVSDANVTLCLRKKVGEHVVGGTVIGWVWAPSPDDPVPAAEPFEAAVDADVRIGFERTIEQDVSFGIRQQIDIGCKALSPAVNDPYTAVQAIDHLAVICCDLAVRPLGTKIITGPEGTGRVVIPGNNFADYIFFIGGLFGRYGSSDLVVMLALLRLFETLVEVLPPGSARLAVIERATVEALADAERSIPRPPSLERVRAAVKSLRSKIKARSEPKPTSAA
ncbi:MAG TPA: DUF2254 domain-containing protein [Propionibacteriaceae bacterium]|nr:DUF2254 domain-containing protein [Propionibacteriaceae bacterium]